MLHFQTTSEGTVMPTSTQPFEVLLEVLNDMTEPASLERIQEQQNGTVGIGRTVWLQKEESISLVLDAGSTYRFLMKCSSQGREEEIS
jgi:hypothetical protein